MRISGKHLVVLVAMCGLIASGVGLVTNVAGLFFSPVAEELGIGKGDVSLTLTIANICFALGGMLSPKLMGGRRMKPVLIAATAVLGVATAAMGLCHSIVTMYLLSALRGLAAGVVGMVFATTVVGNWFHANLGLVTSITFGCSGIAGAIFNPVLSGIIGALGWRGGFVANAVFIVALNLPAILLVPAMDPRQAGMRAFGDTGSATARKATSAKKAARVDSSTKLSFGLMALVFAFAVVCSGITAMPQHFSGLAESYGVAVVGATMVSVCMVANTGGKVVLGALVDRIGARLSCLIACALVAVGTVLLLFVHTPGLMVVGAALFGFCYSLGTVGISMVTRAVFGDASYERVYPTMSHTIFTKIRKMHNTHITPNMLKNMCAKAARLACVFAVRAATLDVTVVPMFSPITNAMPRYIGNTPVEHSVMVIAITAAELCTHTVIMPPIIRNMRYDR